MKYISASEAARRVGVTEKTIRSWISQGKLSFHRVNKTRLALPESEVERLAMERRLYQTDTTEYADISELKQKMAMMQTRLAELESEVAKLKRDRMSEKPPVQTFPYEDAPANAAPSESQKKASSEQSVPKNDKTDLPDGCIHIVDFAKRYGVPDNTAKRHAQVGFKQPDGSFDKLEVESRPRPGRPGQTTYFLTPEQQSQALDFWQRNGVKITDGEG